MMASSTEQETVSAAVTVGTTEPGTENNRSNDDNDDVNLWAAQQSDEVAEISDRVRKALECPVCMEVRADLECYCPNGHVVCGQCMVQLCMRDAMDFCPMCRSPMSPTTGGQLTASRMLMALPLVSVACRYRRHGCGELLRVAEAARHEADCPYWPDVRCLATGCLWLGTHDMLYDHVSQKHPEAVVGAEGNCLLVTDANRITSSNRRAYLVKSYPGNALLWILMSRVSRNRIRVGVFMVESRPRRQLRDDNEPSTTDLSYRISFSFPSPDLMSHRRNPRSKTRKVGLWRSSLEPTDGRDDKAESYTNFMSREGRVEVRWFERASARGHHRTRTDSRVRAAVQTVATVATTVGEEGGVDGAAEE